jgi:hypothetical protein
MRTSVAPSARAANTNSRSRVDSVEARATRPYVTQRAIASVMMTLVTLGPSIAAIKIASRMVGKPS